MSIGIKIEIDEQSLRKLVHKHLCEMLGFEVDVKNIKIMVKSKQNYKSEWEECSFKATIDKLTDWSGDT